MEYKPLSGREFPRYSAIKTFFRLPMAEIKDDYDVALFGVPFDGGTSYRPGSRFAAAKVREASSLGRGFHMTRAIQVFEKLKVADIGDCPTVPISLSQTYKKIEAFTAQLLKKNKRFVACGGDHSITLPILRALKKQHKTKLAFIHFDAHLDTYPAAWGCEFHHGSFARHAVEEGLVDPKKMLQIGIRGPLAGGEDLDFIKKHKIRVATVDDIRKGSLQEFLKSLPEFDSTPTYLSFDVDCLDPAYAPGTGTPVVGGLTSYETQRILRALKLKNLVGVLDGNVIRVLCRLTNAKIPWWKTEPRKWLQQISDELCQYSPPETVNQALMELGATLCTPTKPHCFRCPWVSQCQAKKFNQQGKLPLSKPKRAKEIWIWQPQVIVKNKKIALVENNYAPFLKGQLILPGRAKQAAQKPHRYDGIHSITHHQIFIHKQASQTPPAKTQWVALSELRQKSPSSLIQKALSICSVLVLSLHLISCKTADKAGSAAPPVSVSKSRAAPPAQEISFGQRLTSVGENFRARFSTDGLSLIYVSKRGPQKNQQIFTWSFSESKEHRLTYSDGDADFPLFLHGSQKFAYVSTTDAGKEKPHLFSSAARPHINDLFVSELQGPPIEKLTKLNQIFTSLDYDGTSHFAFSLNQPQDHQVGVLDQKGGTPKIIAQSKDHDLIFTLTNKNHLAIWLEEDQFGPSVLREKKGSGKLENHVVPFVSIHDMSWWDADRETILISGKLQKDTQDKIYLYDLRFDCLIQLAAANTDLWYPATNPEKSQLAVTLIDNGQRQIYLTSLKETQEKCKRPEDLEDPIPSPTPSP